MLEKCRKMYLMLRFCGPTFVSASMIKARILKEKVLILCLTGFFGLSAKGQEMLEVWPGDVNNNGIVNHVDVLWWSVAQDERGPRRPDADSAWAAEFSEAFEGVFPNGLNYAYADCDGNGRINEGDLRIIRKNFGRTRPGSEPDEFFVGNPDFDPLLSLRTDQSVLSRGETLETEVVLGANDIAVNEFFGFAFSIPYNPDIPGKKPDGATFDLAKESWMGRANAEVKQFVFNDAEAGKTYIAIYRKKKDGEADPGFGTIGIYSIIIIEDIVSGIEKVDLGLEDIKLINSDLDDRLVAVDTFSVPLEIATTLRAVSEADQRIRVYPNPVVSQAVVEWTGEGNKLKQVEVFNLLGQRLKADRSGGDRFIAVDVQVLPVGTYLLRIHTEAGLVSRMITKTE